MPIEEIIVVGKRPSGSDQVRDDPNFNLGSDIFERDLDRMDAEEEERDRLEREAEEAEQAFVPPVLVPVVEEIVVTASRSAQLAAAARAARFNLASLVGFVGGSLIAETLREISQARLDEAGELATATDPARPDTPVAVTQPEVIPEIIVTARRPLVRPPQPQFFSVDDDPFIMQSVFPRFLEPAGAPAGADIAPVEIPAPAPLLMPQPLGQPLPDLFPQPFPLPTTLPQAQPATQPGTNPLIDPQPAVMPQPQPLPQPQPQPGAGILPGVGVGTGTSGLTGTQPQVLPLPNTSAFCPPCAPCPKAKKKKKQNRKTCWKKLVAEGRLRDRTYKWTRIDCDTGRELR